MEKGRAGLMSARRLGSTGVSIAVVLVLLAACATSCADTSARLDSGAGKPPGDSMAAYDIRADMPPRRAKLYFRVHTAMEHIAYLSQTVGYRPGGTENERAAADYIARSLSDLGYDVHEQAFSLDNGLTGYNVYAQDRGACAEWTLIIGAHFDSAGGTGSPGANDNASGVATVLELARVFRDNPNLPNLVFVAFGSEEILEGYGREHHHYGSRYMAANLDADFGNVIGMISVDMVGVGDAFTANATLEASSALADLFVERAREAGFTFTFRQDPGWSDHEAFEGHGIPSLWIECLEDPYYHSPQDSYDRIDPSLLGHVGFLLQGFIEDLSASDCRMLDVAGDYR